MGNVQLCRKTAYVIDVDDAGARGGAGGANLGVQHQLVGQRVVLLFQAVNPVTHLWRCVKNGGVIVG